MKVWSVRMSGNHCGKIVIVAAPNAMVAEQLAAESEDYYRMSVNRVEGLTSLTHKGKRGVLEEYSWSE